MPGTQEWEERGNSAVDPVLVGAAAAVLVGFVRSLICLVHQRMRRDVELARVRQELLTERVRDVVPQGSMQEWFDGHYVRIDRTASSGGDCDGRCGKR